MALNDKLSNGQGLCLALLPVGYDAFKDPPIRIGSRLALRTGSLDVFVKDSTRRASGFAKARLRAS